MSLFNKYLAGNQKSGALEALQLAFQGLGSAAQAGIAIKGFIK